MGPKYSDSRLPLVLVLCFIEILNPIETTIQKHQAFTTFPFLPLYTFLESMIRSDQS